MSQPLNADQELVSDVVACQLVIKQILDVLDVIAPVEVREKMSSQLKNIDFTNHPAAADPSRSFCFFPVPDSGLARLCSPNLA